MLTSAGAMGFPSVGTFWLVGKVGYGTMLVQAVSNGLIARPRKRCSPSFSRYVRMTTTRSSATVLGRSLPLTASVWHSQNSVINASSRPRHQGALAVALRGFCSHTAWCTKIPMMRRHKSVVVVVQ